MNLLRIANDVSNIGIASINRGIIKEVRVTLLKPSKAITAIMKPMNREPESPAKMLAGWKLWTKNPKTEPNIIKVKIKSKPVFPIIIAIIPIVAKYIELIPAANPSKPSIKLIQFKQPKIKNIVMG